LGPAVAPVDAMVAAALVHLFTALGAVCALLATHAVISGAWEAAFAWLGVALFIDGIDGTLARKAKVHLWLPRFSGERLDLIIDYLTYVFIPALALVQAGCLRGPWGLTLAALILLSSLFHFSDTESKADDQSFIGFPAIWNLVAFYVFAFRMSETAAALVVLTFVLLTFVPLKWAHPMRTARLRPLTITATAVWGAAAIATLVTGFPATMWAQIPLAAVAAYGIVLTLSAGRALRS
jgi:phosphatidylcholine synthase